MEEIKTTGRGWYMFGEFQEEIEKRNKLNIIESSRLGLDQVHLYIEGTNLKQGPPWPTEPDANVCFNATVEQAREIITALQKFIDTRAARQAAMYGPEDSE